MSDGSLRSGAADVIVTQAARSTRREESPNARHPHRRPAKAVKGEIVEIKTIINHPQETGFRHDNVGRPILRDIITRFTGLRGRGVFRMDLFTGVAANPFVASPRLRPRRATLVFE
jgi:sulfur-oxidizing protein SoxZ